MLLEVRENKAIKICKNPAIQLFRFIEMEKYAILGDAVGFQVGAIIDNTAGAIAPSLTNGYIVGRFKRGPTGSSITITKNNIRSALGYDPQNPDYICVQDCLDTGVPSVQVLRVGDLPDEQEGEQ